MGKTDPLPQGSCGQTYQSGKLVSVDCTANTTRLPERDGGSTSAAARPNSEDANGIAARTNDCLALRDILCSGINNLLLLTPLGVASGYGDWDCLIVFSCSFLSMAPLAGILGKATNSLAEHTGQVAGGLINASFGNAVEIIITVDCIMLGLCSVVQAALIGSVLSNLLLVLGMSFFVSGTAKAETHFNKDGVGASSSCLLVGGIGISIPTLFSRGAGADLDAVLEVSRKAACIMAFIYCCLLFFQLFTHSEKFEAEEQDCTEEQKAKLAEASRSLKEAVAESPEAQRYPEPLDGRYYSPEEEDSPLLSPCGSTILMIVSIVLIVLLSKNMTGSLEEVASKYSIPKAFIGLILLPIIGNAAEQTTAILAAFKLKMDVAIGVAVGSSTQIALLVIPFSVIFGWICDQPMTLDFGIFYSGTFLLSVFLVSQVLQDGSSNWLEGLMLIATYAMIATVSFFVSDPE